jgi:hypothetical protein
MADELLAQLAATPKTLAHLVAEASDATLDSTPGGEWSARTLLAHFRDAETLEFRLAFERVLAESEPEIAFLDPAGWERGRNRTRDRKELLLADFALQRQATLGILRLARPEDLSRRGRRGERTFTLEELVGMLVRHDRTHIEQLERAVGETLSRVLERRARME